MKVLPFKIPKPEKDALVYQVDHGKVFYGQLHQHEEIQFSQVVSGSGTLIVGDTVNQYKDGDILIIGSNVPHVFKSDEQQNKNAYMQTLFFKKDSFGTDFFELEELSELKLFFDRSHQGFKLTTGKEEMGRLFSKLDSSSKLERFILLLQLLNAASKNSYTSLSSFVYDKKFTVNEGNRLRDIFEYTMKHFSKNIPLETIADQAAMTKTSFCKYFKKRTNKTYMSFLNELRIEHACKLLVQDSGISIADVAFQSGFNNLSHFNRQFKAIKNVTPKIYRTQNNEV